jgi:hypothetical protein
MKKIILSVAILFSSLVGISQIKEGSITYSVTMEGLPPEQAAMMDGTEQITYFKGNKSRVEFANAFISTIAINDGTKSIILMDQMGQKMYFEMSAEEMKKKDEKSPEPTIEYKEETKKIAGYDCKKAIVKSKDEKGEEVVMTVWYTEQLPMAGQSASRSSNTFKGLKGAPLEYEAKQGPFNMKFSATSVSKDSVPDSKFVANTDGYVKKSTEEKDIVKYVANSEFYVKEDSTIVVPFSDQSGGYTNVTFLSPYQSELSKSLDIAGFGLTTSLLCFINCAESSIDDYDIICYG